MRLYSVLVFLFITLVSEGQITKQIQGNWKLIGISDTEMTVDLKKGTLTGPLVDQLDSLTRKTATETMLTGIGIVFYSFDPDGKYCQKQNNTVDGEGTWQITPDSLLLLKGVRNNLQFTETYTCRFEEKVLILTQQNEENLMNF